MFDMREKKLNQINIRKYNAFKVFILNSGVQPRLVAFKNFFMYMKTDLPPASEG